MNVTPATIARLRLAAQWILPTSACPTPGPVDVVRSLTALQGQDFPGALWSIGVRSPGSTRASVEGAFNRGEIVRSWPLRGTLHVTAAEDLGWILSLTSGRVLKSMTSRHRQLNITTPDLDAVRSAAVALLAGSAGTDFRGVDCPRASREQLFEAFEAAGQPTATQRGMHLLWLLCVEGTLVQGPVTGAAGGGTAQFFVRMDQWITAPRILPREAALAELTVRYFRSHGPATIKDFQWWAKLTLGDIRAGLDAVRDRLETLECDGVSYYLAPETAALLDGTLPGARSLYILPGFDEYLLGYADRSAALAPHHAPLTVPGNNGMFKATIVGTGKVLGTWRKAQTAAQKRRQLAGVVLPEPFEEFSVARAKALEDKAKAYARFLGR